MLIFVEVCYPSRNDNHVYTSVWFLGMSAKLQKATISFIISVHLRGTNQL